MSKFNRHYFLGNGPYKGFYYVSLNYQGPGQILLGFHFIQTGLTIGGLNTIFEQLQIPLKLLCYDLSPRRVTDDMYSKLSHFKSVIFTHKYYSHKNRVTR